MIIYIMRHAATTADNNGRILGRVDEPILTSELEAIKSRALELQKEGIDLVISSPLLRAKQTAQAIAELLSLEVREHEDLIERDFGILNGLGWDEFCSKYPNEIKSNTKNFQPELKDAETIEEVEERVREAFKDLRKQYHNKKLLVVTHSGVIRIALREFAHYSKQESRELQIRNLDYFRIELPD
jgi:broad specificity phosphatase PhoE